MPKAALRLAACVLTATGTAAAAPAPTGIVIIYADDLGYGDTSCYGATAVQTPAIDRLAREGLRFTDAHSASATCTPSRYALLTGEYAFRRKGTGVLPGDAGLIIEPGRTTLASLLREAGYRTAAVGKWHLGLGGEGGPDWNGEIRPGPLEIGFDRAFLMPATGDRVPCVYVEDHRVVGLDPADPIRVSFGKPVGDEPTGKDRPDLLRLRPSHGHDQTIVNGISRIGTMAGGKAARWVDEDMADTFARRAVRFLEESREKAKPFFLYLATHDIHVPRVPHPRFAGKSGLGPRGDAILQLDDSVRAILEALDRLGLAEDTLVLFTSDNGPVVDDGYRDEAVEKLGDHRPAGPLRGGKYSRFEGGTRVPFIVRWPARVQPGVSDALVCQVDLLASLASLTGRRLEEAAGPDSHDVLGALLGDSPAGRDHLVEHAGGLALRRGSLKLIPGGGGPRRNEATRTELGNAPAAQLYDLSRDLGETTNLAAGDPAAAADLGAQLERIRAQGWSRPPPEPIGPRTIDVRSRGAAGDGKALDTVAINSAIAECGAAGGGTVVLPPGTYLCGTVLLASRVTLRIEAGARLVGSPDLSTYRRFEPPSEAPEARFGDWHRALILGAGVEDVTITGGGIIDGNRVFDPRGEERMRGPHTIILGNSRNVTIRDVEVRDSANYAIFLQLSSGVDVRGVKVTGGWDAIHFRGLAGRPCRDLTIVGCDLRTGDDCIAGRYAERVVVSDCLVNSACNGVRIIGPVKDLIVRDCLFWGPGAHPHRSSSRNNMLSGIILQPGGWDECPGALEDVLISDVAMKGVQAPVTIFTKRPGHAVDRVTIERLSAIGVYRAAASIESWTEEPIGRVVLRDVSIEYAGGGTEEDAARAAAPPAVDARPLPAWGLFVRNAREVVLEDVRLGLERDDRRPAILARDVDRLALDGVRLPLAGGDRDPVVLEDVRKVDRRD